MFVDTENPNWRSILKPEVEFWVFLRMCSDKFAKNGKNGLKTQF
jgi:hypothetical protein